MTNRTDQNSATDFEDKLGKKLEFIQQSKHNLITCYEEEEKEMEEEHEKYETMTEMLQETSGIEVISSSSKSRITFSIRPPAHELPAYAKNYVEDLLVNVEITEDSWKRQIIQNVNINVPSLDIDNIIEQSKSKSFSDFSCMLLEIKKLWYKHCQLLGQIRYLQNTYAVDWQPSNQKLLAMFGDGKIICTLIVPESYPNSETDVILQNVEGFNAGDITTLRPNKENLSLIDWLEYLEGIISKNRAASQ